MPDIKQYNPFIWRASNETYLDVPLHVHLVVGTEYAVWVDSGNASMYPQLQATMEEAGVDANRLRLIVQTHPHFDHIGCSGRLRRDHHALTAGHAAHADWHQNFEQHIKMYALTFPDLVEATPALRAGILEQLDEEHPLDIHIQEGAEFDLGEAMLVTYQFSGHMEHELGYFEKATKTLILGDTLPPLNAPVLFGHVTVGGFRQSLARIEELLDELQIETVLLTHYPPQTASQTRDLLAATAEYLDRIDTIVLNLIIGHQEIHLKDLWKAVCKTMQKEPDYRALRTVEAHVRGLIKKGKVKVLEPQMYGPAE